MNFITRYNPFNEALREFDRLFDLSAPRTGLWGRMLESGPFSNAPATDFYEDADNYYVKAELPGVKKGDVKLEFDKSTLTLSAARTQKQGESEQSFAFNRTVRVPDGVNGEAVKAAFEDGILTVTLPKAEQAKPRQIDVH
ncbi:Hsp20/alpha crystallin family protein [Ruficoccus amylovorans]|uniref:Hsp20/alpha crystallin family protein n=1 Tax=Ruficoccus amylovorans TaxID=1804625 RepID=A0A842HG17_9BACT|nr:Hsp20/alpha crystallin family protein [Ruficoccus amylovorans]MBC2594576.1 Hsp20/alpha crystallin family protein [Ruficoccus amylovorans]